MEKEEIVERMEELSKKIDELDEDIYDVHKFISSASDREFTKAIIGEIILISLIFIIGLVIGMVL